MAKAKKKVVEKSELELLTAGLVDDINKKFSKNIDKAAFFLSEATATSIEKWVPTGCDILDLAIGNKPNSGWPVGRIVEITGLEASGKSLLAAYALKNTQEMGGVAVYIDTEAAVSRDYLQAIGVNIDKLLYIPLETLEDIFDTVESIITRVRESSKDTIVTIVVDSIMGATTKNELTSEHGKDGYATEKAIVLSKAMRKITNLISRQNVCLILTNQLRVRMGISFGDPYSTSGGKAVAFHSSVRVRLKSLGKIKTKVNGIDQVVGINTSCVVQKNRLGPPLKNVTYDIYFDSGIDNYGSWLKTLKDFKLATTGQWWSIPLKYHSTQHYNSDGSPKLVQFTEDIVDPATGEVKNLGGTMKFRSKDFASIVEANPNLRQWIYEMICDAFIMVYQINKDFGIDDISIDENLVGEHD